MFEAAPADAEGGWRSGAGNKARQPDGPVDARVVAAAVAELLAAARRLAGLVANGGAQDAASRRAVLSGLRPVDGVLAGVRSAVLLAERDSTTWQRPGVASFEAAHGSA
ncbi:hypothetical protein HP550_11995, partial [Cellulomonas humilata]